MALLGTQQGSLSLRLLVHSCIWCNCAAVHKAAGAKLHTSLLVQSSSYTQIHWCKAALKATDV